MEILNSFEFKRPSKSQYAPVAKALVEDGVFAVRLVRGEDFPEDKDVHSVGGPVSLEVQKLDPTKRSRAWVETEDAVIISLYEEGEGPKPRRKRKATA